MERERHLRAVEAIDQGLQEAAHITIEQGVHAAVEAGRMTQEEAKACLEAYYRTFHSDGDDAA